jgi:hypothetical protein
MYEGNEKSPKKKVNNFDATTSLDFRAGRSNDNKTVKERDNRSATSLHSKNRQRSE